MGISKLMQDIMNGFISDDEALNRLEEMRRDYIISSNEFIEAKRLLFV